MKVKRYGFGNDGPGFYARTDGAYVLGTDFDRVNAERDALQQLLNARDDEIDRVKHIARCNIAAVHEFLGNTEHHDDYKRDMAELENQA